MGIIRHCEIPRKAWNRGNPQDLRTKQPSKSSESKKGRINDKKANQ